MPATRFFSIQNDVLFCEGTAAPGPAHNAAFPHFLRCADGSLLLVHRVGAQKNSPVGELWLWRSRDDGETWRRVPFPCKTPAGNPADFRPASVSDIGSGRIAMLLTWIDHPDDSPLLVNPKTEGLLPVHIGWTASVDQGATWTAPREIDVSPLVQPAGNGPMRRLPNNDLLVPFETYKHFDDPSPWSANAATAVSHDNGKTWASQIIAADPSHQVSYFDPHVYPLRDDSLLNVMWADDRRRAGVSEIIWTRSTDGGRSWSAPAPTGLDGQFSTVIELGDGRLLMLYVVRHGHPAIRMAMGSADGREWQTRDDWIFHSHSTDDLARSKGKDFGDYLQNMGQWTFGWPALASLPDGNLLAGYYTGQGDRSSVHLARIAIR
ncbi:MAG: exo-alpha-sialidase [Verrucomicrobia bacterium]|nr:exo-alpha-sialidase [Verrucomicrobiota bacterium]